MSDPLTSLAHQDERLRHILLAAVQPNARTLDDQVLDALGADQHADPLIHAIVTALEQ